MNDVSASREKKTRQELVGQGLTEKQIKTQQEEQRAKRNRIIYTVLGVVCVVLVAALLIWDSGFFQSRTPALTVSGKSYTAADLQYYYDSVYNSNYMYAQWGFISGLDYTKGPKDQYYDELNGKTWHDYFVDSAVEALTQLTALTNAADAAGYKISEEGRKTVQDSLSSLESTSLTQGYSSLNSYLKGRYGRFMTRAKYEEILLRDQRAREYENQYIDSLNFSDQDLESYYTEHADTMDLFGYNYVYFNGIADPTTGEDGTTVQPTEEQTAAAIQAAKDKAEALQTALKNGTSFEQATAQYAEDSKASVYADMSTVGSSAASPFSLFKEWMLEDGRKVGDVNLVESSAGNTFYVVQFMGRSRNTEQTGDVRHALIAAEQDEGATEPTQAQYDAAKAKADQLLANWLAANPDKSEDAFAQFVQENTADTSSASSGGLYTNVGASSGFVEDFTNWVLDPQRQPGETGVVQNTGSTVKGWHIMYFVQRHEETWKVNCRNSLTNETVNDWLDGLVKPLTVVRESGISSVG